MNANSAVKVKSPSHHEAKKNNAVLKTSGICYRSYNLTPWKIIPPPPPKKQNKPAPFLVVFFVEVRNGCTAIAVVECRLCSGGGVGGVFFLSSRGVGDRRVGFQHLHVSFPAGWMKYRGGWGGEIAWALLRSGRPKTRHKDTRTTPHSTLVRRLKRFHHINMNVFKQKPTSSFFTEMTRRRDQEAKELSIQRLKSQPITVRRGNITVCGFLPRDHWTPRHSYNWCKWMHYRISASNTLVHEKK